MTRAPSPKNSSTAAEALARPCSRRRRVSPSTAPSSTPDDFARIPDVIETLIARISRLPQTVTCRTWSENADEDEPVDCRTERGSEGRADEQLQIQHQRRGFIGSAHRAGTERCLGPQTRTSSGMSPEDTRDQISRKFIVDVSSPFRARRNAWRRGTRARPERVPTGFRRIESDPSAQRAGQLPRPARNPSFLA